MQSYPLLSEEISSLTQSAFLKVMLLGNSTTFLGITFPLDLFPSLLCERSLLSSCVGLMYCRRYLSGNVGRYPYILDRAAGKWTGAGRHASDASNGSGEREAYRRPPRAARSLSALAALWTVGKGSCVDHAIRTIVEEDPRFPEVSL